MNNDYMTVSEAAEQLQVSTRVLYRMIERGEIETLRVAHQYRIPRNALDGLRQGGNTLTVSLTRDELQRLRELISECQLQTTPERVLQGFVSDLTGSDRDHGEDERLFARQYFDRTWGRVTY